MKHIKKETEFRYKTDQCERTAVYGDLIQFCHFAKEHDYIEVTEWNNGEGYDIDIETNQRQRFQLTHGQYNALKYLIDQLNK